MIGAELYSLTASVAHASPIHIRDFELSFVEDVEECQEYISCLSPFEESCQLSRFVS